MDQITGFCDKMNAIYYAVDTSAGDLKGFKAMLMPMIRNLCSGMTKALKQAGFLSILARCDSIAAFKLPVKIGKIFKPGFFCD